MLGFQGIRVSGFRGVGFGVLGYRVIYQYVTYFASMLQYQSSISTTELRTFVSFFGNLQQQP